MRARITVGRSASAAWRERLVDRAEVVAVDGDGAAAERLDPPGVRVQVPAQLGRAALAEPVDVDDRGQVGQPVVGRLVERLPHRALGHLAVAAQHPHPVRQLVEVLAGQRDADAVGQPLAQRAGGDVDPRQHRGGVALQRRAESPVAVHQLLVGDDARRLEHRVQQRGGVALGEDQVVVGRVVRPLPVVAEMPGQQHRHQVGGRHARRRMAGPGGRAGPDRVDPQLLGELMDIVQRLHGHCALPFAPYRKARVIPRRCGPSTCRRSRPSQRLADGLHSPMSRRLAPHPQVEDPDSIARSGTKSGLGRQWPRPAGSAWRQQRWQ